MIVDAVVGQGLHILEGDGAHLRLAAAVLVVVGDPEIAVQAPARPPAVLAQPGSWPRGGLGDLVVVPADDGHGVVGVQGAAGRLVVNVTGVDERVVVAQTGAHDPIGHDLLFDGVDVAQVRADHIPLDVPSIEVVVIGIVPFRR